MPWSYVSDMHVVGRLDRRAIRRAAHGHYVNLRDARCTGTLDHEARILARATDDDNL